MICAFKKCAKTFTPDKPWGKYCSEACGDKARHQRYYRREKRKKRRINKQLCVHGNKLGSPAGEAHRRCARMGSL